MKTKQIAILVYGEPGSGRNALTEEKYKVLADSLLAAKYQVRSILYCDSSYDQLSNDLLQFQAVLVWVNPVEHGGDRSKLNTLLSGLYAKGVYVSAHPETIMKMGTKEVLHATKRMEWGCDTHLYKSYFEFADKFPGKLHDWGTRVLKQSRGNGGKGVFKVQTDSSDQQKVVVTHAAERTTLVLPRESLCSYFEPYFSQNGIMIDQQWHARMANGMVRCYVCGTQVTGFGYQEINALHDTTQSDNLVPSKRYYFTERCGLFRDLREIMESRWISQLQQAVGLSDSEMPIIWDADFFIGDESSGERGKYTLCEINASCVSPFPPSAVAPMVKAVNRILG